MIYLTTTYNDDEIIVTVNDDGPLIVTKATGAEGVSSIDGTSGPVEWASADIVRILGAMPLDTNARAAIVDFQFTGFTSGISGQPDTITLSIAGQTNLTKTIAVSTTISDIANNLAIDSDMRLRAGWFASCSGDSSTQSTLRYEYITKGLRTDLPTIAVTRAGNSQLTVTRKIQSNGTI